MGYLATVHRDLAKKVHVAAPDQQVLKSVLLEPGGKRFASPAAPRGAARAVNKTDARQDPHVAVIRGGKSAKMTDKAGVGFPVVPTRVVKTAAVSRMRGVAYRVKPPVSMKRPSAAAMTAAKTGSRNPRVLQTVGVNRGAASAPAIGLETTAVTKAAPSTPWTYPRFQGTPTRISTPLQW
jgi:hypothetical protein